MAPFTDRELNVMSVWERGPSTVAEVRGHLDARLGTKEEDQ